MSGDDLDDRRGLLKLTESKLLLASLIVNVILVGVTFLSYYENRKLASHQLTLAFPPVLKAGYFHVWESGKGKAFDGSNHIPSFTTDTELSGAFYVVNRGREWAKFEAGGCLPFWWSGSRLPMNSPLNNDDLTKNKFKLLNKYDFTDQTPSTIATGQFIGCNFNTKVSRNPTESLYVIGFIHYYDKNKTFRSIRFARKYDPNTSTFNSVKDEPTYEDED